MVNTNRKNSRWVKAIAVLLSVLMLGSIVALVVLALVIG